MPQDYVGGRVCIPKTIDYNDEYYGYQLVLKDTKGVITSVVTLEGSIWANKGNYCEEKYQITLNVHFNKPSEATVLTPRGKYEIRFDRGGVFSDVTEAIQSTVNKFRRGIEEIRAAYESLPNSVISVNGIREAEINCPFCGGNPMESPEGGKSICEDCNKQIMIGWPEMWGIEFTPADLNKTQKK
ncbi:MAG: hypothetical protein FWC44_02495 [Methanomassiliicoccaceae archaeon]|nr:hypothetical protein [Methanomassiliicoccaceae archaeon]